MRGWSSSIFLMALANLSLVFGGCGLYKEGCVLG